MGLGLLTAACGTNETQRAATGALAGAGIGALAGGPFGALIGAAAGGVGGSLMPEDATDIANNALGREHRAAQSGLSDAGLATAQGNAAPGPAVETARATRGLVEEAQQSLKDQNLYDGRVDGIVGPRTQRALGEYQQRQGLQQTATLDRETIDRMNLPNTAGVAQMRPRGPRQTAASGGSMPGGAVLSPDQIRDRLEADGYSTITSVRQVNDSAYDAQATKDGTNYEMQIDARSGRIASQQALGTGGSGSSSMAPPANIPGQAPQNSAPRNFDEDDAAPADDSSTRN